MALHRYFVEWSAPNYRNAGSTTVMANNQPDAVKKAKKKDENNLPIKQCDKCFAVHRPAPKCPMCGHVYETQAREIEQVDGDLQEITKEQLEQIRLAKEKKRQVGRAQTLDDLLLIEQQRGYKKGWENITSQE